MNKLKKLLYVTPFVVASSAFADDPTIADQLQTAATSAITTAAGVVGAILVAAMAIPVGRKIYSLIKGALGRA